jgi:tetratricopeptide (TPR) repeat protein
LHEAEQYLQQHPDLVQRDGQAAYLAAIVYRRLEREQQFLASLRSAERKGVPRSDLDLQEFLVQVQAGAVAANEIPQRLGAGITDEQQEDVFDAMTRGCLRTYQVRAAHDLIDRWLKVRPSSLAAQLHRGRAWQLSEDLPEATEAFERVLQQVPQHYEATVELATLLLVRSELPRAQQLLSALVARDPQDMQANVLLAQCERREGKGAAALARLEALSLEKASPADRAQVLKLLGQLRFDADNYAAAVVDLRAALALSPRDAELHQALASALAATGDADGATEQRAAAQQLQAAQERLLQALRAVRKNPTDPEARFEQAAALNEAQFPAAAVTALRALLADHPDHAAAKALYDQLVRSRTANDGS